jgi:MFS family permease
LGAVGDWYLNFGYAGIVFGGLLSGLIYTGLMAAWRRAPLTPFMLASIMCVVVFVVPTGFQALTPARWLQWALPLLICARYLDYRNKPVDVKPLMPSKPIVQAGR